MCGSWSCILCIETLRMWRAACSCRQAGSSVALWLVTSCKVAWGHAERNSGEELQARAVAASGKKISQRKLNEVQVQPGPLRLSSPLLLMRSDVLALWQMLQCRDLLLGLLATLLDMQTEMQASGAL